MLPSQITLAIEPGHNLMPIMYALFDYRNSLRDRAIEFIADKMEDDAKTDLHEMQVIDDAVLDIVEQLDQALIKSKVIGLNLMAETITVEELTKMAQKPLN
nr:hypothetical protein [uncultured Arsenicibacter sp.]